jgi:hypothetical protein
MKRLESLQSLVPVLTGISHQISTAAVDPGMSTALRFFGLLDVLLSTPAGPSVARRLAKRRIHVRLRRLATKPGEKCGLIGTFDKAISSNFVSGGI